MSDCDHIIGLYIDYGACELLRLSEPKGNMPEFLKTMALDPYWFSYCPNCGEKLEVPGTHKASDEWCLVGHMDGKGNVLGPCAKCLHCKEWIRPENMEEPCEKAGRSEKS